MGKASDQQEVSSPRWTTIVTPECTTCASVIGIQNGPGLQCVINETAGLAKVSLTIILQQRQDYATDWERLGVVVARSAFAGIPQAAGHPI
jgi:hypothetical protein